MYLPTQKSSPESWIRHAKYAARSLRAKGFSALSADVASAGENIRSAGRAAEHLGDIVSEALADRDFVDGQLDDTSGAFRLALSARSANAMREAPYSDIYYRGSHWVTDAPIDENAARYRELIARAKANLPADDTALQALEAAVPPLLEQWTERVDAVSKARVDYALATANIDKATDEYARLIQKVVAQLIADIGKPATRRIFLGARS